MITDRPQFGPKNIHIFYSYDVTITGEVKTGIVLKTKSDGRKTPDNQTDPKVPDYFNYLELLQLEFTRTLRGLCKDVYKTDKIIILPLISLPN